MASSVDTTPAGSPSNFNVFGSPEPQAERLPNQDGLDDEDMGDLFGDEEGAPAREAMLSDDDGLTAEERAQRHAMEYEEDEDNVPENIHRIIQEVAIPNQSTLRSSDGNLWLLRLPNYVKYDPRPFDPDSYVEARPEEEKDPKIKNDQALTIQMEILSTIRWRWVLGPDGKYVRQSNSRIIKWEDGSMSLQLGKELYDISVNIDTAANVSRSAIHGVGATQTLVNSSQKPNSSGSQAPVVPPLVRANGLSYVVAQHAEAAILRTEAQVAGTMNLRPSGTGGSIHNKFRKAMQHRHSKVSRLRFAQDSEVTAAEREIAELQKSSKSFRKPGGGDGTRRRRAPGGRSSEPSDRRKRASEVYSDDDDEADYSDDDNEGGFRRATSGQGVGSAKRGGGEYQEDDDFLVPDTDEEEEAETKKKRSRAEREAEEAGEDDLDAIEARIERNQRLEKVDLPNNEDDDNEEEEEATAIRRSSGKRKTAAFIDSDDD